MKRIIIVLSMVLVLGLTSCDNETVFDLGEGDLIVSSNEVVAQIPVKSGLGLNSAIVQLKPEHSYSMVLPDGFDRNALQRDITLFNEEIDAPVAKGDVLGILELKLEGETVVTINLVAVLDVQYRE